jgi:hypothetical protein
MSQYAIEFQQFDAETFLAGRLKDRGLGVFIGATDETIRKDRFRKAIIAGNLASVLVDKHLSGKSETFARLFERIYGEPLTANQSKENPNAHA